MNDQIRNRRGSRDLQEVSSSLGVIVANVFLAGSAFGQTPPAPTPKEQARVPTSHANVHMGSSSGQELLVVVPKGTVLPVLARKGEWVQVGLTPELRKTSMVMRWYKNEDRGWMHDSTVQVLK